jgi:glycine cleavage system H protein
VYFEFPEVGDAFEAGEAFGTVESVKSTSSVYAPVALEVTEVNEDKISESNYELINQSAENDGWVIKGTVADAAALDALMDADAYKASCDAEA